MARVSNVTIAVDEVRWMNRPSKRQRISEKSVLAGTVGY